MQRRSKSAFTLIELLVVIAIIAILAAILFPVFASAREKARQTACVSNMKQVGLGLMQYIQDYDGTFPGPDEVEPVAMSQDSQERIPYDLQLMPYVKSVHVFSCPSDAAARSLSLGGYSWYDPSYKPAMTPRSYTIVAQLTSPSTGSLDMNTGVGTYKRNFDGTGSDSVTANGISGTQQSFGYKESKLDEPSDTIALMEEWAPATAQYGNNVDGYVGSPNGAVSTGGAVWELAGRRPGSNDPTLVAIGASGDDNANPTPGHFGRGNYIFADGHVKALTYYQVVKSNDWYFQRVKQNSY